MFTQVNGYGTVEVFVDSVEVSVDNVVASADSAHAADYTAEILRVGRPCKSDGRSSPAPNMKPN